MPVVLETAGHLPPTRSAPAYDRTTMETGVDLISKTTVLHVHHAFLSSFLPSLHDYDAKRPILFLPEQETAR